MRAILAAYFAALGLAAAAPSYVGVWTTPPAALPYKKLPDVPLAGNGVLGLLLDSAAAAAAPPAFPGPGHPGALDVWVGATNAWSCRAAPAGALTSARCGKIALGGVSLAFSPALALVNLTQELAGGALTSAWASPAGGLLTTRTRIHPTRAVFSTHVVWAPAAGDARALALSATTWVAAASAAHGAPAPAGAYCADAAGARAAACAGAAIAVATRAAASGAAAAASPLPWSAALATAVIGAPVALSVSAPAVDAWGVVAALDVPAGQDGVWLVTAEAEAASFAPAADPGPAAAAAVAAAAAAPPAAIGDASDAWWTAFYNQSSVTLPPPFLQELYDGAAYVLGSTAAAGDAAAAAAPPGLYGVWATSDYCAWNGDLTLDYNQESTFFGAFATNHAAQFATYAAPLIAFAPAGAAGAQAQAALANVSCPASALHFACHLAPWGAQSDDASVYMHWNLPFALLPIASQWEYTHDEAAATAAWPLIAGAVDWLGCFLARDASGALHDTNPTNPDAEHEGQLVPDPQIGVALAHRVAALALDVAAGLGIAPPRAAADVVACLVQYSTAVEPAPAPPNPDANFTRVDDYRYAGDFSMTDGVLSADACAAGVCAPDSRCECFTWCAGPATAGCPRGPSCWKYAAGARGNGGANATGFVSGCRVDPPPPSPGNETVWVAFAGATPAQSDTFSSYPAFPAEMFSLAPLADAARLVAQASASRYGLAPTGQSGRPLDVFSAAAVGLAGAGGVRAASAPTAATLAAGLRGFASAKLGRNALAVAEGGGVENAGLARALADMLLFSAPLGAGAPARWFARAFAAWPTAEDAAFSGLLAKGGCAWGAALVNGTVAPALTLAAAYPLAGAAAASCSLAMPWPAVARARVRAACAGADVPVTWAAVPAAGGGAEDVLSVDAPRGAACVVTLT